MTATHADSVPGGCDGSVHLRHVRVRTLPIATFGSFSGRLTKLSRTRSHRLTSCSPASLRRSENASCTCTSPRANPPRSPSPNSAGDGIPWTPCGGGDRGLDPSSIPHLTDVLLHSSPCRGSRWLVPLVLATLCFSSVVWAPPSPAPLCSARLLHPARAQAGDLRASARPRCPSWHPQQALGAGRRGNGGRRPPAARSSQWEGLPGGRGVASLLPPLPLALGGRADAVDSAPPLLLLLFPPRSGATSALPAAARTRRRALGRPLPLRPDHPPRKLRVRAWPLPAPVARQPPSLTVSERPSPGLGEGKSEHAQQPRQLSRQHFRPPPALKGPRSRGSCPPGLGAQCCHLAAGVARGSAPHRGALLPPAVPPLAALCRCGPPGFGFPPQLDGMC